MIIGITVSIIMTSIINNVSNSIRLKANLEYQDFPYEGLMVNFRVSKTDLNKVSNSYDVKIVKYDLFITDWSENYQALIKYYYVDKNFLDYPVINNNNPSTVTKNYLIAGRAFNENDLILKRNVVIVPEVLAQKDNNGNYVLGNSITINDFEFKVIGVLKNTYDINENIYKVNNNRYGEMTKLNINCYLPMNNETNSFSQLYLQFDERVNATLQNDILLRLSSNSNLTEEELLSMINSGSLTYREYFDYYVKATLKQELKLYNILKYIVIGSVIIFIITILLFSIKDRINEFAIKKIVGASTLDLYVQVISEMAIIIFIANIIGLFFSTIISFIIIIIMSIPLGKLLLDFTIDQLINPMILIDLFIFIFSLIPFSIIMKSKLIDLLKFD